jgi:hypothetical protein
MILLYREAGESRRGAGLLRPFEGRDKIAPPYLCLRRSRARLGCAG